MLLNVDLHAVLNTKSICNQNIHRQEYFFTARHEP